MVVEQLLGAIDSSPKRVKLAILDHLDSPDEQQHGQPKELVIALLCELYPWLTERYATTADGTVDVARLIRMREIAWMYHTAASAVRKPFRQFIPGGKGRPGQWRDNWTDAEKTLMERLKQLRRERENSGS